MLIVNGGARWILVQVAAGVLLAAWTLLANLGSVYAQPQPTPERWGVRPFAEEEREYKEKVAQLEREIHQVQSRLNQTRNNLEALWAEWSADDKTWAEHQFFANPQRYGGALGGGLSLAKEQWDRAIGTYETVMAGAGRVDMHDPLVGPEVRDQVWSAHLRVLRSQLEYFNTTLAYENIRYIAIKEQQQGWFGDWNAFIHDALDHIEYVYWSHVDAVMTELFNCMAKSTANAARNALLNQWGRYKDFTRVGQPDIPEPLYSGPTSVPNGWNVRWKDPGVQRVPLGQSKPEFVLDCIRDAFRAGLVSAVVSGLRKSFVDRVTHRDNVHPQIAEYWWSRFIWDGPIEDPFTHLALDLAPGRPAYVARKLEDAFWNNWGNDDRQPYKEQAIEQLKELLGARQSGRLAPVYEEAQRTARAAYDNAVRRGAIRPQQMEKLKQASDKAAADIYARKAPTIGAKAAIEVAEFAVTLYLQGDAWLTAARKELDFEQQEQVLVKTHNEIFQCLMKMEMSTGPAQIIAIYELGRNGRQGIDEFFRQCREPPRAQRERALDQLKEIDRQISTLLDEATGQSNLARTQCEAALTACAAAARSYTARAASADQLNRARAAAESKLAALQSRIAPLDSQAEQAAQAGQAMGQAMVGAEQAALAACEALKGFPSLKTDAERQGQLAVMRQGAARAGAEQRICRERGAALRGLAGQIRAEAAGLAAEADAVAAASGPGAADIATADSDLERCRGSLGAARNAANALPALEQKALQLHSQAETVARPMRGNQEIEGQMETLWRHVEPVTIAGRGPAECLPRAAQQLAAAEAAQGRAQRALADAGAAPRAIGSPAAIKQAAAAAARKAENAGTFADDYLGRADVAAADAQNCVAVAEDFARKAATAAATTSGTSAGTPSGAPTAGSGNVEQDPRLIAECASRFPGSVPVWDAANNRAACRCPDGSAPNAAGSACIDCAAVEANFAAAFNAGDLSSAQGWLAEGGRCAWAGRAQAALANATRQQQQADLNRQQRELDCLRLETNIMGALNARNLGAAQGLLAQAMAMGCSVSGQTQFAVQEAIRREQQMARDQQQQQALAQFAQNWQRMLEGMQRPPVPPPSLGTPAPSTPAQTLTPRQTAPAPQAGARQGPYVPSNVGQPCADLGQQAEGQCKQMVDQCKQRNCAGGGYSGCAVDCPGCGNFDGFIGWCALHPSYRSMVAGGLSAHLNEIQGCIQRFLSDNQPGRRERAAACQRESQGRLDANFKQWIAQACQARCSQDGRRGTIKVMPHRCECE